MIWGYTLGGTVGQLPRKLLGCVMLLVVLLCISACSNEEFEAARTLSGANLRVEAEINAAKVALNWEEHDAVCEQSRRHQLEEFLDMKLRHSRESAPAEASPMGGRLRGARHAFEEAQLNYDHAREDVRLDCYHRRQA